MKFRAINQKEGEKAKQFLMWLRVQADLCDYKEGDKEREILTQFMQGIADQAVRNKYIRKELKTLEEVVQEAELNETLNLSSPVMPSTSEINAIQQQAVARTRSNESVWCYKCGMRDHYASAHMRRPPYNPMRGGFQKRYTGAGPQQSNRGPIQCHKCGGFGHVKRQCRYEHAQEEVAYVQEPENAPANSENVCKDEYLFFLGGDDTVECVVGGVRIEMVLDTGCQSNIISEPVWALMKAQGAKVSNARKGTESDKKFKAFGQVEPIEELGSFEATLKIDDKGSYAKFYVLNVKDKCLLGKVTITAMQLIDINVSSKRSK